LTIGIPGFFLALAPNARRYVSGFVRRVLRFAIPAGFIAASSTFSSYALARVVVDVPLDEARTTATLTLLVVGLWVLGILARPLTPWRAGLLVSMVSLFLALVAIPPLRDFYALELPEPFALACGLTVAAGAAALLEIGWEVAQRRVDPRSRTPRFGTRRATANPDA
jgi:cation-transporting ATPase E